MAAGSTLRFTTKRWPGPPSLLRAKGEGLVGLDANNRKDRDAFQADLISLAKFGKLLFETATKVQNPGANSVAQWRREFRDATSEASVDPNCPRRFCQQYLRSYGKYTAWALGNPRVLTDERG